MFKARKGFTVVEIAIVVAIVAVLAGVWYVAKNKVGADVAKPGIITNTTGITPTGGIDPAKMGMGRIQGTVTEYDNTPIEKATVVFAKSKCDDFPDDKYYSGETNKDGDYIIYGLPPGNYCGQAVKTGWWLGMKDKIAKKYDSGYKGVYVGFGKTVVLDFKYTQK